MDHSKEILLKAHHELECNREVKVVSFIYQQSDSDMSNFWLSFLEMTDILLQNVHACHVGNFEEYLTSTYEMLPSLLAYNNHDYGGWLPDYWAMLCSLPAERFCFFSDHFSQSMTGLPYSRQPMDLWIETTMNLGSKLKQGWLQLLQNEKQLFCQIRNVNNISHIKNNIKKNLKCKNRYQKHVDCQPARMKKDEQAVQDLINVLTEFEADPFDDLDSSLRSL